jgi:hypothetical protein
VPRGTGQHSAPAQPRDGLDRPRKALAGVGQQTDYVPLAANDDIVDAYDRTRDKKVIVITLLESSIILAVELSLLGHPAREAVARVIATSSKPPTFYWNYRTAAPPSGSSARRIWVRGSSYPKTEQKPEMRVPAGR